MAAAVWLSQVAPIDIRPTTGPIDITFLPRATPHHAPSSGVPIPTAPAAQTDAPLPTIPRIDPVPWHPGSTIVDPSTLTGDPGTLTPGAFGSDQGSTSQVFQEAEVDDLPSLVTAGRLRYPPVLAEAGIDGAVTLTFVIDTAGRVDPAAIEILAATHPGFVAAAEEAVSTSLFHPARKHGAAVRVRVRQRVTFHR
ncbi:MAG: TonB family protein [Gemmatimonadetes bacterium]|nr:TonB family protein [Gemmatimonadota bacterium]